MLLHRIKGNLMALLLLFCIKIHAEMVEESQAKNRSLNIYLPPYIYDSLFIVSFIVILLNMVDKNKRFPIDVYEQLYHSSRLIL